MRQDAAHHRPAHHQFCDFARLPVPLAARKCNQVADQRSEQHLVVSGSGCRAAIQGHQPADQWPAEANGLLYGVGRADVMDDHSDIGRPRIGRHLAATQFDDQLAIRTHRVTGRHRHNNNFSESGNRFPHRRDGFGLVILDSDFGDLGPR